MSSVEDFKKRFPEFAENEDERIQMFLDDAALIMSSEPKWLGFYSIARLYYAAHFMVVSEHTESGDSSALSPVKKQEVDDVLIESAISDVEPSYDELVSTSYGKRVMFYRKICFTGMYGI